MEYEQLRASIKEGKLAPLYIFEGPEDYLIEYCIDAIKQKLTEPWSEMMNYKSYNEIPPIGEAREFLDMLPVMADKKLAVFRKCGLFYGNIKNKADWEKLLCEPIDTNCTIIWEDEPDRTHKRNTVYKAAQKACVTVSFPLQSEAALKKWLDNIAKANGKAISGTAAAYLIQSLGKKMRPIKTEFEKILAYSKGNTVTREDIDAVIVKPITENVFNLIDSIFEGRREQCYRLIAKLKSLRAQPVELISLLASQIVMIYKAKVYMLEDMPRSQITAMLGGGYGAEKCVQKAQKLKIENIRTLIGLCYECDKNIKQGATDGWTALNIIIAEYKFY